MASVMRRLEVPGPGRVEMRSVPIPEPGPGEVLVAVESALTCGTDLKLVSRGHARIPLPSPLGHEFAGTVARTGPGVEGFASGDAIACVPTAPCGRCSYCSRGRENLCPEAVGRIVLGAFADYVLLPSRIVATRLFHRPASMPAVAAAALEPLACVVHGAARAAINAGDSVLILGDGPIALLFLQLARMRGASRILVAGHHPERLQVAAALGAATTVLGGDELAAAVHAEGGADRVIECVGRPEAWEQAHTLAAPGGRVLLFGGCAAGTGVRFDAGRIHYDEIDVIGAFHYGGDDVRAALDLLAAGAVRIDPLVTHSLPLSGFAEALDLARSGRAVKVEIRP